MKNNNKGFSLIETLIVSTFVVSSLIYLYTQINAVKTNYDISFKYNTVVDLYSTNLIGDYLNRSGYTTIINGLSDGVFKYYNITTNTYIDSGSSEYYNDLISKINVTKVIFTTEDVTDLIDYLESEEVTTEDAELIDGELIKFMKRIDNDGASLYRIITEFSDGTYATIQFS